MKTCSKCGVEKGPDEFYREKSHADGLRSDCKECVNARIAARYKCNPDKYKIRVAEWARKNVVKIKSASATYREENREEVNLRTAAWKKTPSGAARVNALNGRRHAAKLQAMPAWANEDSIGLWYKGAAILSTLLGEPCHVDHRVPLRSKLVCGLHNEFNLQLLSAKENITKGNRHWPDMPQPEGVING